MKLHIGKVKNPVDLVTYTTGTIYVDPDGVATHDGKPRNLVRMVKRLFGLSTGGMFFGVITYDKPT